MTNDQRQVLKKIIADLDKTTIDPTTAKALLVVTLTEMKLGDLVRTVERATRTDDEWLDFLVESRQSE